MGRYSTGSSTEHRIEGLDPDGFRISWTVDRYYSTSRLRFPTAYSRYTDFKGALRFARKHKIYPFAIKGRADAVEKLLHALGPSHCTCTLCVPKEA